MKILLLKHAEEYIQSGILGHSPNAVSIYPPLGLEYIGSTLENEGHKVEIIDFGAEALSKEQLKNSLTSSDAVGIGVYTNNYKNTADFAKMIKELDPKIPLIIGGPHCIFFKRQSLIDISCADISVELEGEHVFPYLVRVFEGKKKLSDVHGIYYRENNKIKAGKSPQIIDNLDDLAFPARHLVYRYDYGNLPWGYSFKKKFTSMITSRGCPFNCRFCTRYNNIVKDWGYRKRSADNVVREIQEINDKYKSVAIVDDNFLADIKRAHKIFDKLLETGTTLDLIITGARVDSADKDLYKKMKKVGVKYLCFGIESGNQDVLDFYNKKITLQQIQKAVHLAKEMNFTTQATFILGAPFETNKYIENTIKFACSLPLDIVIFQPLHYVMGSDLWLEAVKDKKISKNEYHVDANSKRGLGNFTEEELKEYSNKAFRRFYLRPNYLLSQIQKALLHKDIGHLKIVWKVAISSQWRNILS
jgi:anaerobic magnesium-protoporphyrin IX monomethyl ester cyclase